MELNMDTDRANAMLDILSFFRSQMKAMSVSDRNNISTILAEHPSITVAELVDFWIETVYRTS